MIFLRLFLSAALLAIAGYTLAVGMAHGWNLMPVFFGDIAAMGWPGQFNLDFLTLMLLSGLWLMWRHRFSPAGVGLGLIAVVGGMLFLSVYLLILSFQTKGDIRAILLGPDRHAA